MRRCHAPAQDRAAALHIPSKVQMKSPTSCDPHKLLWWPQTSKTAYAVHFSVDPHHMAPAPQHTAPFRLPPSTARRPPCRCCSAHEAIKAKAAADAAASAEAAADAGAEAAPMTMPPIPVMPADWKPGDPIPMPVGWKPGDAVPLPPTALPPSVPRTQTTTPLLPPLCCLVSSWHDYMHACGGNRPLSKRVALREITGRLSPLVCDRTPAAEQTLPCPRRCKQPPAVPSALCTPPGFVHSSRLCGSSLQRTWPFPRALMLCHTGFSPRTHGGVGPSPGGVRKKAMV